MSARQSSARGQRGQSEAAAKDNNGEKSAFSMEGDEMEGYKLSSPIVMKPISQVSYSSDLFYNSIMYQDGASSDF